MGEVRSKVLLENRRDRILFEGGYLDEKKIRQIEINALVDTGAVMTLLSQDLVQTLGLPVEGQVIVTLADDSKKEFSEARDLSLTIGNRRMNTDCLVGPPQCEPLIGRLVLEQLDLIIDPAKRTLSPRPESPFLPSLKLK